MVPINKQEVSLIKNYLAGLKDYRKELSDMSRNIESIDENKVPLVNNKKNIQAVINEITYDSKQLNASIRHLEEELRELLE